MSNLFLTTVRYNKLFSAHILNSDSSAMQFEIHQKVCDYQSDSNPCNAQSNAKQCHSQERQSRTAMS